jgi:Ca2+-binding RTX toxin-like protein
MKTTISMRAGTSLAMAGAITFCTQIAAATRNDILGTFAPPSELQLAIGADISTTSVTRGSISLRTDTPFCQPTSTSSCTYRLNYVFMRLEDQVVTVANVGTYLMEKPYALIDGVDIDLVDDGSGLVLPPQTPVQVGAVVSGPDAPRGLRVSNTTLGAIAASGAPPTVIGVRAISDLLTLDGDFPFTFDLDVVKISGRISGFVSAQVPLANTAPFAVAAGPGTASCGQAVVLDGSQSVDKEANHTFFRWSIDGNRTLTGQSVSTVLPPGQHTVTLSVLDLFTGRSDDAISINVLDPKPTFTFVPPTVVAHGCGAINLGTATASSACGPVVVTNNAPAQFKAGRTTVTWTATGPTGVQETAQQDVIVLLANDPACCPAGTNRIVGTSNNDVLTGSSGRDCILGLGAQDQITGGGGDDIISAGDGDDIVRGSGGNDVISAGSGQDQLFGDDGDDVLAGNDGNDVIQAGAGADIVFGGAGQDQLSCGVGPDQCFGDAGDDRLFGEDGDDLLDGGENNNQCTGGNGFDTIVRCTALDTAESVGPPGFPGDPSYQVCTCRPSKCTDCSSAAATCQAISGCPAIIQCVQATPNCNLPHECSALCESGRTAQAISAARQLASCFGGCD